jgi:polyisoprenoid-binding protein YceI
LKGGLFAFDGASGVAQGEILVDAESEKSNDASLDRKIRTQTLEVAKYPGISFHPEDVIGTLPPKDGVYHFKLKGSLTIHGTDHTVTADVDATQNGDQVLLKSTFTVPYVEWGMKDAGTFLMRDRNIRVTIESHGVVERGDAKATPAS